MILIFTLFVFLLLTGLPLYTNLGLCSALFCYMNGFNPLTAMQRIVSAPNSFTLLAIPFFIMMGNIMNNSGVTKRLFNFANALVGHWPGGLGHVNVVGSVIFAGMSGAAVADAGGLGAVEIQAMRDVGYDDDFSCAITAASSAISPIIPPSLALVLIGVIMEASVGRLFLGGIMPGLLMGATQMVMVSWYAVRRKYPRGPKPTFKRALIAFKEAFWALLAPAILLVGMFSGFFTTTEAAIVAALYSLILGLFVYKEFTFKDLPKVILSTSETNGNVLALIMTAAVFGWMLSVARVPQAMTAGILSVSSNKIVIILLNNLLLIFVGMFMEGAAAILILAPILIPILTQIGMDITQACVMMVFNITIGLITPPVGVVLYVISDVAKVPFERVTKATLPFMIPLVVTLLLITFIPWFTLWLPNLFFGR
jgi:tripartite ATP-independent transporter DctM subunit